MLSAYAVLRRSKVILNHLVNLHLPCLPADWSLDGKRLLVSAGNKLRLLNCFDPHLVRGKVVTGAKRL